VILKAAISVIEADGMDALTIRGLARDLGVGPMALYTHFRDKDAILRAVAAELFGRFEVPSVASSDIELLRETMRGYFRLLIENPVLLRLDAAVDDINLAETPIFESIHACLERLRIDHRTAVGLAATLARFVVGSAFLYPRRCAWDDDPDHWAQYRRYLAMLSPVNYPSMHRLARDFPAFTQREVFEFGLETQLAAVANAAGVKGTTDQ
jgi:AcrR family transcriptional regulator